jgi:hypothetical protein
MKCGPEECPIVTFSDLTPAEQRKKRKHTAKTMLDRKFTEEQIAKQLHVSQRTVSNDLRGFDLAEIAKSKRAKTATNPRGAGRRPGGGGIARSNGQNRTNGNEHVEVEKVETIHDSVELLLDQLDKDNIDAPFLAYVVRASDSWRLALQAVPLLPMIFEQTKPCSKDWTTLVELTRKAADEWAALAIKVEAMKAPVTRRTKLILAA